MLVGLLIASSLGWGSGGQEDSPKEQAAALAKKAKRALKERKAADAYLLYSEAAALQPSNKKLRQMMEALQSRAALESKPVPPAGSPDEDLALLPPGFAQADVFDSLTAREYALARELRVPPELKGLPGTQDFDLRGNARTLFDQVAQRFGLETVYDGDYPAAGPQIRFQVPGVDYRDALHDLEAVTNSFVVPLSPRVFMVAQDTAQKRTDLEQSMVVAVPMPSLLTTQQLTEIAQAVKQATNVDKIAFDPAQDQIIIRDRISRALPAQALLNQLIAGRPEVMIEVEFLEVSDSDMMNYGFNVTNQFSAVFLGHILNNIVTIPQGATALLTFGGGKTLIGLTSAEASMLFNETIGTAKTLYRSSVRSVDGQAATFHIGEKYPIITYQYAGQVQQGTAGNVHAPPPSFTYEDLGVQIKITPHIHGTEQVTLGFEGSFELLAGQSVNNIPVIVRRELKSEVRLVDGEWAIVAGLMNPVESKSTSGFWGLAHLPLIGNLFKQVSKNKTNENMLIAIRPILLALPPDQTVTPELRVGTETRPYNPL